MNISYQRVGEKSNLVTMRDKAYSWQLAWEDGNQDDIARMESTIIAVDQRMSAMESEIDEAEKHLREMEEHYQALIKVTECASQIAELIRTGGQPKAFKMEVIP